jgi:archaetidylinositol phosphate synthase
MVLNKYRYLLPRFLNGPVAFCVRHKITPNQISVFGFFVSCLAAIALAFPRIFIYNIWLAWLIPIVFLFAGYLDVLDGAVARETKQVSKFGGFLDSTLDRISDAVVIIGLIFGGMLWPNFSLNLIIGFIALSAMFLISYTRSRAELEGVVMKGIGFMERGERVLILLGAYIIEATIYFIEFIIGLFTAPIPHFIWFYPIFFLIFTIFCIQTFVARVVWAYKWLSNKMPEKVAAILAENQK